MHKCWLRLGFHGPPHGHILTHQGHSITHASYEQMTPRVRESPDAMIVAKLSALLFLPLKHMMTIY